jgi:adenosylmethionine-8-amino-7-oxononanoate aminotransferase
LARKYHVLVIFDEVMTAWGRTGKLFAMNHCEEKPDIVCLSKGLTGGVLPLGLTVTTSEVFEAFLSEDKTKALLHGHSFTGNALACAAACASMDLFELDSTWEKIAEICNSNSLFSKTIENHPMVEEIRLCGTILAIEVKTGEGNTYFSAIRDLAYSFFLSKSCLIRPLGNVIFINPPYCISKQEIQAVYLAINEFIDTLIQKN